jgi:nicotinamide mononucleotide transporter
MFSIDYIILEIAGYPLSLIELLGTLSGLVSVWLATRGHVLTWLTGIVNEIFFFLLFFQVQLYSDMFLQVFFFVVSVYGWFNWRKKAGEAKRGIVTLSMDWRLVYAGILVVGTVALGFVMGRIDLWLPQWFAEPAAYPYPDAFTTMASVLATILLARKCLESWWLWIVVDVVAVVLYFLKGINFVAIEYMVFLVLAMYGLLNWRKEMRSEV